MTVGDAHARRAAGAAWAVRAALAASFLSAVADRFGLWGPPGAEGVAWGNFEKFTAYTGQINAFAPLWGVKILAWAATIAEVVLSIMLIAAPRMRIVPLLAAGLLTLFALGMLVSLGPKSPLDYSVPTAAAAAFLLHAWEASRTPSPST